MVRVADLVAQILTEHDVRHVFMVTGGGAMHLNDALGKNEDLEVVCCHHEQACAMAAESYARLSNRIAAVNVTTGPGGINALNGVFGAYTDSIPMIIISGQVKRETMVASYDLPLRQLGDQEVDIIALAKPLTKMAEVLNDPAETRYLIEKALFTAKNGRPGPVWIDIPIDIQAAPIEDVGLRSFNADEALEASPLLTGASLDEKLDILLEKLAAAERPAIIAGGGVRLSGAYEQFLAVVDKLGIPVTTAWNAHDLIWDTHPLYAGRPGSIGDRPGNWAVQNSDFLLALGTRLNVRQISYNWTAFARVAYEVMIDADLAEMEKPTLDIDLPIHADLRDALEALNKKSYTPPARHHDYLDWCLDRRKRYPVPTLTAEEQEPEKIDPYFFLKLLSTQLNDDDVIVTGDGTACVVTFQVAEIKAGQRLYTNSGSASMGYDLPGAVGAAIAQGGKRVICIAGDGSIMMNVQELQTIVGKNLDVKIFVLNNNGYSSIRQTQTNYFPDNVVGCDPASGVTFPAFVALGKGFGMNSHRCSNASEAKDDIVRTLSASGPQLLEVMLNPDYPFSPKLSSRQLDNGQMESSPLEDLAPFLSREELAENLLIPPYSQA